MNRITRIAAVASLSFAAAGSAFADDITIDTTTHQSLKSRAEVLAELNAYQQKGINPWSTSYNPAREFRSVLSRDAVLAELKAAQQSGELVGMQGEDSGSAYLAQVRHAHGDTATVLAGKPASAKVN